MSCGIATSESRRLVPWLLLVIGSLWACSTNSPSPPEPPDAPQRICSVSLAGDELLSLLVEPERVVCVSSLADNEELSNVTGFYSESVPRLKAKVEPVLATKPDLVIVAPWNEQEFLRLIQSSGVPTLVLDGASDLDAIRQQLLDLGDVLGVPDVAQREARAFDERLAEVARRLPASRPSVLSFSHLIVAGKGTTVDALIAAAGGVNAAQELELEGHEKVSIERLLTTDPDVLLLGFDSGQSEDAVLEAYPQLGLMRAAREKSIVVLPPRQLTTVTPFIVDGIECLAAALLDREAGDGA